MIVTSAFTTFREKNVHQHNWRVLRKYFFSQWDECNPRNCVMFFFFFTLPTYFFSCFIFHYVTNNYKYVINNNYKYVIDDKLIVSNNLNINK